MESKFVNPSIFSQVDRGQVKSHGESNDVDPARASDGYFHQKKFACVGERSKSEHCPARSAAPSERASAPATGCRGIISLFVNSLTR